MLLSVGEIQGASTGVGGDQLQEMVKPVYFFPWADVMQLIQ